MKKRYYGFGALGGLVYGAAVLWLSRLLLRGAAGLCRALLHDAAGIGEILDPLRTAEVDSPWMAFLLAGLLCGAGWCFLIRRCRRKTAVSVCVGVMLLLPWTVAALLCTQVNGIRPSAALMSAPKPTEYAAETYVSEGTEWYFGFGRRQILPDEDSPQPLYIAGYNSAMEISDVLDLCEARAVWMDTGDDGVLLIGVDCVALDSGSVACIRDRLADIPNCAAVHVYATHTHAGPDTLGLWGPTAVDGKNDAYMEALFRAAEEAGREAAAGRVPGTLYYGRAETKDMYRDSRYPEVYDANLYQLRFDPRDGGRGVRMLFYGAHAESLRGSNSRLSRDFPGRLCDGVTEATGDDALFLPGAIGGLIMTKEFVNADYAAEGNMRITGDRLVTYALSIGEEETVPPRLTMAGKRFAVPMDNIGFAAFKYLGILGNRAIRADSATGYGVETEMAILQLGDLAVALLPGEIFPELVTGKAYGVANPTGVNPEPLEEIAARYGAVRLLIVGLANDEVGYIVPPSDFMVHDTLPYLEKPMDDRGENHYEETNSLGPACADRIADTFAELWEVMPD